MKIAIPCMTAAVLLMACAASGPVAPRLRIVSQELPAEPYIFLNASHEEDRVREALIEAGIRLAPTLRESNLLLRATFGSVRGRRDCGPIRNFKYELFNGSQLVMWTLGRGGTGRCRGNIIDESTREFTAALH